MTNTPSPLGDLSPNEFRAAAHAAVDWIAEYLEHPERYPVRSQVAPGDVMNALPASPPVHGESLESMMHDFEKIIVPGV
ncbi:MAG: amino acid decarboxylase, partial [Gemmatimonadaceae bacterium]